MTSVTGLISLAAQVPSSESYGELLRSVKSMPPRPR